MCVGQAKDLVWPMFHGLAETKPCENAQNVAESEIESLIWCMPWYMPISYFQRQVEGEVFP